MEGVIRKDSKASASSLGFCVNGDLLSFLVRSVEATNARNAPRRLDPSFGPVITGAIRFGDSLDGHGDPGRGFYVEDGGHPYLLSWMEELSGLVGRTVNFVRLIAKYRLGVSHDTDLGAEISRLLGPGVTSESSLPVLTMERDVPNGTLTFRDDRLECDWKLESSRAYYDRVRRSVRDIAEALGATYMDNPSYAWNLHQIVTAHPLGGCAMATTPDEGVVDASGEVFGHPGLFISDGSVMPGPVRPNPSLTIAALADRFADSLIARWTHASPA